MKTVYEITYTVVCDDDGLVSHTLKSLKEIIPNDENEEDNDEQS